VSAVGADEAGASGVGRANGVDTGELQWGLSSSRVARDMGRLLSRAENNRESWEGAWRELCEDREENRARNCVAFRVYELVGTTFR
jgi:hypothetical protein